MTFPWQLLGDYNLRLAGLKGVRAPQWAHSQNALDPRSGSGVFSQKCCQGKYFMVREYTKLLTDTQVYVVPPSVVRGSRQRYRQSGARTDQSDAELLAHLLRTDQHRLQPWCPDSLLTRQMRSKISLHLHLTRSSVRLTNRLRAVLLRYYPAALEVFYSLASPITLAFIQAFPTPQDAATLSFEAFQRFARHHQHARPQQLPARYARLQTAQIAASPDTVVVCQGEAVTLAALLLTCSGYLTGPQLFAVISRSFCHSIGQQFEFAS